MNLDELVKKYVFIGYDLPDALSKVAQDVIILKISKSSLNQNVTIKGGVVMHSISKDKRRATRDIDFDFIKYSLDNDSINNFVKKLNQVDDITIVVKSIKPLHHQDYNGKRIHISLIDKYDYHIDTKLDIGVHKDFDIKQEEYCFDLDVIGKSVTLFINSKEQIFTEKLKSLLKFAYTSTRYKDIFDFYYLIKYGNLNKSKLKKYINKLILCDSNLKVDNFSDIYQKIDSILNNKRFISNLNNVKTNWLDVSKDEVINCILNYLKLFESVETI